MRFAITLVVAGFALMLIPAGLDVAYLHQMWLFVAGVCLLLAALAVLESRHH
jgi:hypothetical protein